MLILTRRVDELLYIGDDIKVMVLQVKGNQVRLGIDAPAHISILREELWEQFQKKIPATLGNRWDKT